MKGIKIFAIALLFLSACQKEQNSVTSGEGDLALKNYSDIANKAFFLKSAEGLDLQMASAKNDNGKQVSRPLKSSGSGTISLLPNGCGDGTLKFISVGTGNSSHLGKQEQTTSFCMNGLGEPISAIEGVATAANGDKLNYTFVAAGIDQATGFMYQKYVFTGGTGKFTNASGNTTLLYSVNTPTNYEYTGTGSITY